MPTTTTTNLHEFLSSTPFPLTDSLIRLSPYVYFARNVVEILSWSRPTSYDSWVALAVWWATCLLAQYTLRYLLPIVVILLFTFSSARLSTPLVTENSLQAVVTDLTTIQSLLPNNTVIPNTKPAFSTLLRVSLILYAPYLLLTYYVPLRVLIALLGTVLGTWKAPWAAVLRNTLRKSAWVRWSTYCIWSKLSGQPLSPPTLSYQTLAASNSVEPGASLRFLFTIYENQRWWVGLDYSAALLPNERPSWCSASLQPMSPPNAFILPEPTSSYVRDSTGKRVKRTAIWKWEEPEWKVLIRKEDGAVSRVEKPIPSEDPNPSLLMKAAGKMKETQSTANGDGDYQHPEQDGTDDTEEENLDVATDADGWVYGDNKWEGRTSKGGMGKYTRYRRWTRVAVVTETVEVVEDGETGVDSVRDRTSNTGVSKITASPVTSSPSQGRTEDTPEGESPLRQRLKSALTKGTL